MTAFDPHIAPTTFATASIPGFAAWIKERPEDFLVDEIPAYSPAGEGEHLYLLVQRRDLSTLETVEILAGHFGVPRTAVGYAGLKDKRALTRQVFSVHLPGRRMEEFPSLERSDLSILWADYHANKLRQGHLRGNRFSIRLRGMGFAGVFEGVRRAKAVIEALERTGVPNRFGVQRFGLLGNNHEMGRAFLVGDHAGGLAALLGPSADHPGVNDQAREAYARGDFAGALALFPRGAHAERQALRALAHGKSPKRAAFAIDFAYQRLYLSAFQSAVFNAVLDARLANGTWRTLQPGDLAFKHDSGAVFAVEPGDTTLEPRLRALEVSPSGPMWSDRMTRASGEVDALEVRALEASGVTLDHLRAFQATAPKSPSLMEGARRPLRVPLVAPDVEGGVDEHGPFVRVAFDLPRGSFATAVLAEILKGYPPDAPRDPALADPNAPGAYHPPDDASE